MGQVQGFGAAVEDYPLRRLEASGGKLTTRARYALLEECASALNMAYGSSAPPGAGAVSHAETEKSIGNVRIRTEFLFIMNRISNGYV